MYFQLPMRNVPIEDERFVLNSFEPDGGKFYFGIRFTAGNPLPNTHEIIWGKELGSIFFEDCGGTVVTHMIARKAECHQMISFPNKHFDQKLRGCFMRYLTVIGYILAQEMEKDILEEFQGFYIQQESGLQRNKLSAIRLFRDTPQPLEDEITNDFMKLIIETPTCSCRNCQRRRRGPVIDMNEISSDSDDE